MKLKIAIGIFLITSSLLFTYCGSPEEKKMKYYNKGMALYESGKYEKARVAFSYALTIDFKFAEAYYMVGMIESRKKNWKSAQGLLSKAVELKPNLLDAQLALGDVLLTTNDTAIAKRKAELVLSSIPGHQGALLLKTACLMGEKKYHKAELLLKSITQTDPNMENACLMVVRSMLLVM